MLEETGYDGDVDAAGATEAGSLEAMVAAQPLDLTPDQVTAVLDRYAADGLDYDEWLTVGMALFHQHEGRDDGYEKWMAWSERSGKHDPSMMRVKWRSFGGHARPVTFASVIAAAGGLGEVAVADSVEVVDSLEAEASGVSDRASYAAFKRRVVALPDRQLTPDIRALLASRVHTVWGKAQGMTLRDVKRSFAADKKVMGQIGEGGTTDDSDASAALVAGERRGPPWLQPWVYDEANCLFTHMDLPDYAIKREAFRAKFDRMPEVVAAETDAATYALRMVCIPTSAQSLYWPGMPRVFYREGSVADEALILNTYHDAGVRPLAEGVLGSGDDAEADEAVAILEAHIAFLIEDEREQRILLDWMAWVYRNPGRRVHWAMLIWGIEGNGKTFLFRLMRALMGRNARPISTSMIDGRFNDWAVGSRLACVEEIRIAGTNKWQVLDQIKPMLTNEVIGVEPKGRSSYDAPNFCSYLMLTNHQDAIPMSGNDRRYCVMWTQQREEQDIFDALGGRDGAGRYFDRLFDLVVKKRADAIARYFLDREIDESGAEGGFQPEGRAPVTGGIKEMREANVSDDEQVLLDAIEEYQCEVVSRAVLDVTHLNICAEMDGIELPKNRHLAMMLREMGYDPVDGRVRRIKGVKRTIWYRKSMRTEEEATEDCRRYHTGDHEDNSPPF